MNEVSVVSGVSDALLGQTFPCVHLCFLGINSKMQTGHVKGHMRSANQLLPDGPPCYSSASHYREPPGSSSGLAGLDRP